jgi:DNA-binding SARP family transcriptional activator
MEFRILGSFEVVGSEGLVDLRGAKRRGVLAYLVVHAGQPVSIDRLVEELWGERGTAGAARTVQTYVSQLRKLFLAEPPKLETRPGGYVLDVDPDAIDAYRFEQGLVAAGAEGDAGRRLAMLDETFELWRGPPMEEFAGSGWADREATRLGAFASPGAAASLRHSPGAWACRGCRRRSRDLGGHPFSDEKLWAQLMLALYRSGRQADALGAYQHARRHLVDGLGIEPGPELAELEHRILDHDPTLATSTARTQPVEHHAGSVDGTGGVVPAHVPPDDIVDSVSRWERDPAGMSQGVARHDVLIRGVVSASGGEPVRTKGEGDSTFSVFSHPWDAVAAPRQV